MPWQSTASPMPLPNCQPFTTDKAAAQRAILKTHAHGITALYDALVRVNHDLAGRPGKKVIIVFTDGSDNASMLTASTAIERAKARGIPIYTIAQGQALEHPELLAQLTNISRSTGGSTFQIRQLSDIGAVFEKVSQDLLHGYLVAFQPEPATTTRGAESKSYLAERRGCRSARARASSWSDALTSFGSSSPRRAMFSAPRSFLLPCSWLAGRDLW